MPLYIKSAHVPVLAVGYISYICTETKSLLISLSLLLTVQVEEAIVRKMKHEIFIILLKCVCLQGQCREAICVM